MLADFCLRLAAGLAACLLLLSPASSARPAPGQRPLTAPTAFRTQLLVILGLCVGAALWMWETATPAVLGIVIVAAVAALLGSVTWSLERSPGGVGAIVVALGCLLAAMAVREPLSVPNREPAELIFGGIAAAALLGAATSAMLLGHDYLVAPSMSLVPLFRLLAALGMCVGLRAAADGVALLQWTNARSLASLNGEQLLWLPTRWAVGLVAPAVLCGMAWQTAKLRATQSATGILYVVVIFCFLGELTAMLLRAKGLTM